MKHTLRCGCGFRGGGAVPRGAVLGAGAGVGAGAVKKSKEGTGAVTKK